MGEIVAPWRSSTVGVAPGSAPSVPGVIPVVPSLAGAEGLGTVGFVLAEAIALYVGYGALTRVASPVVHRLLAGD